MQEVFTKVDFSQRCMALVWTWDGSSVCFLIKEIHDDTRDEIWGRLQRGETSLFLIKTQLYFDLSHWSGSTKEKKKTGRGNINSFHYLFPWTSDYRFQFSVDFWHKQPTSPVTPRFIGVIILGWDPTLSPSSFKPRRLKFSSWVKINFADIDVCRGAARTSSRWRLPLSSSPIYATSKFHSPCFSRDTSLKRIDKK